MRVLNCARANWRSWARRRGNHTVTGVARIRTLAPEDRATSFLVRAATAELRLSAPLSFPGTGICAGRRFCGEAETAALKAQPSGGSGVYLRSSGGRRGLNFQHDVFWNGPTRTAPPAPPVGERYVHPCGPPLCSP